MLDSKVIFHMSEAETAQVNEISMHRLVHMSTFRIALECKVYNTDDTDKDTWFKLGLRYVRNLPVNLD